MTTATTEPSAPTPIAACPACDLLIPVPAVPAGHQVVCGRCGTALAKSFRDSVERVLALSFAGLLIYLPAMLLPLMTLSSLGIREKGNVIDSVRTLYESGYVVVAVILLLTAVVVPLLKLLLPFSIALNLKLNRRPGWLKPAFKLFKHVEEWGMVEVYLLGILVTLIKMHDMASIDYGAGFFCFIVLVLLTMATSVSLDHHLFWHRIGPTPEPGRRQRSVAERLRNDPEQRLAALPENLTRCDECGLLVELDDTPGDDLDCPRCDSPVHARKRGSVPRTLALVVTAMILFLPANLLPIMRVDFLGVPERSTILDGILYFFKEGSYGIGLIILTASVLVPLFKIVGLIIILWTIRTGQARFLKQKASMFRFIQFIGRWSMLDIFVVALLSVLVNFGFLTSIHTAPGATYFAAVVVCTMVAAIAFDPRVMWDRCDPLDPAAKP